MRESWLEEIAMISTTFAIALVLTVSVLLAPLAAPAQPSSKLPRLGVVATGSPVSQFATFPDPPHPLMRAFFQRLHELGWEEGKNLLIERRSVENHLERFPAIFEELLRLPVDVLYTPATEATIAAVRATRTVPIVSSGLRGDVIAEGLVKSIAHPDDNLTGFTGTVDARIIGKNLQQLTEMVPSAQRVAVLTWSKATTTIPSPPLPPELADAARTLGVQLIPVRADTLEQLPAAFEAIARERPDALFVTDSTLFWIHRQRIAEFALQHRLPMMGPALVYVESGALLAYVHDQADNFRAAAEYVDKVLKGTKPADLPVQLPTRFYLWVNKKTADALGIEIPYPILLQADRVIE
jgi:putative ABC transport system substrate-binding protein